MKSLNNKLRIPFLNDPQTLYYNNQLKQENTLVQQSHKSTCVASAQWSVPLTSKTIKLKGQEDGMKLASPQWRRQNYNLLNYLKKQLFPVEYTR